MTRTPADRLATALDVPADHVETDGAAVRVRLPDRTLVATETTDGRWSLALRADGQTVSKFGLFDDAAAVCERAATLRNVDVRYTVCCDG